MSLHSPLGASLTDPRSKLDHLNVCPWSDSPRRTHTEAAEAACSHMVIGGLLLFTVAPDGLLWCVYEGQMWLQGYMPSIAGTTGLSRTFPIKSRQKTFCPSMFDLCQLQTEDPSLPVQLNTRQIFSLKLDLGHFPL